jgi:hypothetical protein
MCKNHFYSFAVLKAINTRIRTLNPQTSNGYTELLINVTTDGTVSPMWIFSRIFCATLNKRIKIEVLDKQLKNAHKLRVWI